MIASQNGQESCLQLLLARGANVEQQSKVREHMCASVRLEVGCVRCVCVGGGEGHFG